MIIMKDEKAYQYWNRTSYSDKRWIIMRWKILERDKHTCQYCGRKAPETELQVHHRTKKKDGGIKKINNLITICIDCHRGMIPIQRYYSI